MDLLIKLGSNVNSIVPGGRTPLHLSAMNGKFETSKRLIESGANPNAFISADRDFDNEQLGFTPLHLVIQWYRHMEMKKNQPEFLEIAKLLIGRGTLLNKSHIKFDNWETYSVIGFARDKDATEIIDLMPKLKFDKKYLEISCEIQRMDRRYFNGDITIYYGNFNSHEKYKEWEFPNWKGEKIKLPELIPIKLDMYGLPSQIFITFKNFGEIEHACIDVLSLDNTKINTVITGYMHHDLEPVSYLIYVKTK